jgi:SAM-dependent methyltransferase
VNFYDLLAGPVKRFPAAVWAAIGNGDFRYRVPDSKEQAEIQLRVAKYLENGIGGNVSDVESSLPRRQLWDRCYAEAQTLPPFLIKAEKEPVRLGGHYVIPESVLFEAHFLSVVRAYLFDKFFSNVHSVAEFGCGTGHNLLALARQQPGKTLFGLDWSASALDHVNALRTQFGIPLHAAEFDLFNPRRDLHFNLKEVGVLTVGALEQVGKRFEEFLYFLLSRQPPICMHLEPVVELYDEEQPFDQLAMRYHRARGYLEGFLPALQRLERYGLAEILALHRIPFGSFYHEAYTYVVWRPVRG